MGWWVFVFLFFASCLPVCFFPCAFLAEVWCRGLGNQRSHGFSFGLALGIVLLFSEVVKTAQLLTDSLSFPVQRAVQHCDMEEMEQQGIWRFDNLAPRLMHTGFHDCLNQPAGQVTVDSAVLKHVFLKFRTQIITRAVPLKVLVYFLGG